MPGEFKSEKTIAQSARIVPFRAALFEVFTAPAFNISDKTYYGSSYAYNHAGKSEIAQPPTERDNALWQELVEMDRYRHAKFDKSESEYEQLGALGTNFFQTFTMGQDSFWLHPAISFFGFPSWRRVDIGDSQTTVYKNKGPKAGDWVNFFLGLPLKLALFIPKLTLEFLPAWGKHSLQTSTSIPGKIGYGIATGFHWFFRAVLSPHKSLSAFRAYWNKKINDAKETRETNLKSAAAVYYGAVKKAGKELPAMKKKFTQTIAQIDDKYNSKSARYKAAKYASIAVSGLISIGSWAVIGLFAWPALLPQAAAVVAPKIAAGIGAIGAAFSVVTNGFKGLVGRIKLAASKPKAQAKPAAAKAPPSPPADLEALKGHSFLHDEKVSDQQLAQNALNLAGGADPAHIEDETREAVERARHLAQRLLAIEVDKIKPAMDEPATDEKSDTPHGPSLSKTSGKV